MTAKVSFEHLEQHGVPRKDIELLTHWFDGFPKEVDDAQLAMVWALQVLPWDWSRKLLSKAFNTALHAPGVLSTDDKRLQTIVQLLAADKVDIELAARISEECYSVVEVYSRLYGLDDDQPDPKERISQAMTKVVMNSKIDPTVRLWVSTLPTLGACTASTFGSKVEDSDQMLARSVYSSLFVLLPPPKTEEPRERTQCIDDLLCEVYAELAEYLTTWARPWGT